MNFVFSTILLVLLLLPGGVAIRGYFSSVSGKNSSRQVPFDELLLRGIILSIIIHSLFLIVVLPALNYKPRIYLLYTLIAGEDFKEAESEFRLHVIQFFTYIITVIAFSWLAAKFVRRQVRNYNIDLRYISLTSNYWYHIFSARFLEEEDVDGTLADTDLIWLDILVENNIIYSGILHEYYYSDSKDELETIVLKNAYKSCFSNADGGPQLKTITPLPVDGDMFIIPFKTVLNLNVYYLRIETGSDVLDEGTETVPVPGDQS